MARVIFYLLPSADEQRWVCRIAEKYFLAGERVFIACPDQATAEALDELLFSFEALLWLLQFIADSNALQQIVFWTMGSLGRATWTKIGIVGTVLLLCLLWSARQAWALTALRAGEDQARSFGIAVERLRLLTLLRVSLLAATALSFVGTIGFVGLVGPHIARMLLGEDHRYYLPGSALAGALMLSLASILSKALVPGVVLPIGIITALVGVPLFMTLVLRQRRVA